MPNLQEIEEKIFFEAKNILETLSKINTKEDLLAKQDLFAEITDRIAFLRILDKNVELFNEAETLQTKENQDVILNFDQEPVVTSEEKTEPSILHEDVIEEEVMFTNELNEIDEIADEQLSTEVFPESRDSADSISSENSEENRAAAIAQKEKEFQELEERRRKIVEIEKPQPQEHPQIIPEETQTAAQQQEKKFRLANIKGLKQVQNLFDDDPLQHLATEDDSKSENPESGSILRSNIPTEFMEAEKKKPEFRIDLNDKVAFTKVLFKGNEEELRKTVDKLNSFTELEDARHYLSELYYKHNWKGVDEYAQRLWSLVENKFM